MKGLFGIVYVLCSFAFVVWLIHLTGNFWWVALLVVLLGALEIN